MNHLDILKQKLVVKPIVNEREKIVVKVKEYDNKEGLVERPAKQLIVDKTTEGYNRADFLKKWQTVKWERWL